MYLIKINWSHQTIDRKVTAGNGISGVCALGRGSRVRGSRGPWFHPKECHRFAMSFKRHVRGRGIRVPFARQLPVKHLLVSQLDTAQVSRRSTPSRVV